jgi:aromatic ring-opening dioxygenase catalytic subunit (LigB family)
MMFLDSPALPTLGQIDRNSPAAHWFRQLSTQLALCPSPKAVLVITAHWETTDAIHISAQEQHTDLLYDYHGFPSEAYQLKYQPAGDVRLSKRVQQLLEKAGIRARLDNRRHFDHGVFIPLKLIYPEANIPVVSMSILQSLSPSQHLAIGKALQVLRREQVLIIGSGSTVHGFRVSTSQSNAFVSELTEALTRVNSKQRETVLLNWETALPFARMNHPREEHLIPLHVVVGAAGDDQGEWLNPHVINTQAAFQFGV